MVSVHGYLLLARAREIQRGRLFVDNLTEVSGVIFVQFIRSVRLTYKTYLAI